MSKDMGVADEVLTVVDAGIELAALAVSKIKDIIDAANPKEQILLNSYLSCLTNKKKELVEVRESVKGVPYGPDTVMTLLSASTSATGAIDGIKEILTLTEKVNE